MKVLILNDCADKQSDTFDMLRGVCDGIAAPHEIEWINIAGLQMQLCAQCFKCLPCGECALPEDDAHRVGRMIFAADALVVGLKRPEGTVSRSFKVLLDRCRAIMTFKNRHGDICPWRQGRVAVIVSPENVEPPQGRTKDKTWHVPGDLMNLLVHGGFQVIDAIDNGLGQGHGSELLPIEKARALGCSLSCMLVV